MPYPLSSTPVSFRRRATRAPSTSRIARGDVSRDSLTRPPWEAHSGVLGRPQSIPAMCRPPQPIRARVVWQFNLSLLE